MQKRRPRFFTMFLAVGLFMLLALATATAYAATVMTTMRIDRAVKAGAGECYRTVGNVAAGDSVKLLGRNEDGSWVFIWADAVDGWVPASSVNASAAEVSTLSVWTDHFNGDSCGPPQFDSRICGSPGSATSATTVRWTDIYTTADPALNTPRAYPTGTPLTLVGRDFWGCWVRVRSTTSAGNGWVPIQALDVRGVLGLPVLVDNSGGCQIVNGQVVNCDNRDDSQAVDIRTVNGATTIYSQPNTASATARTVPTNGRVRVTATRAGWIGITSRYGNGWIQEGSLNPANTADAQVTVNRTTTIFSEPDTDFPTSLNIAEGTPATIVGFATGWIRITSSAGDGWVPANTIKRTVTP